MQYFYPFVPQRDKRQTFIFLDEKINDCSQMFFGYDVAMVIFFNYFFRFEMT